MESLLFLVGALALIGLGTTVVVVRAREPKGFDSGIKGFQREMKALAPEARRVVAVERIPPPPGPVRRTVLERTMVPDAEPAVVPASDEVPPALAEALVAPVVEAEAVVEPASDAVEDASESEEIGAEGPEGTTVASPAVEGGE